MTVLKKNNEKITHENFFRPIYMLHVIYDYYDYDYYEICKKKLSTRKKCMTNSRPLQSSLTSQMLYWMLTYFSFNLSRCKLHILFRRNSINELIIDSFFQLDMTDFYDEDYDLDTDDDDDDEQNDSNASEYADGDDSGNGET